MTLYVPQPQESGPAFLRGGGEMGAAIRAYDWASTPLGAPKTWPRALRTCLSILLASRQPMWLWWGPERINFYNDAYIPVAGGKHPGALGKPARQVWAEIWGQIESRIAAASAGEASYAEAELLVMQRNGYHEETYYTFSFSPVPDDDGGTGGIFCANSDDTERVIGARRLALLRDLASRTWDAKGVSDVYRLAADALALNPRDMPFALVYGFEADGAHAALKGCAGIRPGHAAAPEIIGMDGLIAMDGATPWPLGEVLRTGRERVVKGLAAKFGVVPKGPWDDAPHEAMVLPLATGADSAPRGVLIAAVNPYRPHDGGCDAFLRLVAREIASAVVAVEAFEAERDRAMSADILALEIEHRRRIERHQNLLLDELNHRVKNTLATVQAMAVQTLKGADAQARDAFIARLFALSGQHDLLTLDNWEGASFEGVIRRALRPWREEERVRFRVEGPPVYLEPKRALALGMGFHELAANAGQHGALSNATGTVEVHWTADPAEGRLKLRWEEKGGPPVSLPTHRGFGLRLIEDGLPREISGTVRMAFPPEGVICEWDMKLP